MCIRDSPLTPWINKDLWNKYDFREFDIVGEPYLSIDYNKVFYFTDTGRSWNSRFSIKDHTSANQFNLIKSTDDLIDLIDKNYFKQVCILTHPNRWSNGLSEWLMEIVWQTIKNIGKIGLKYIRNRL